VVLTASLGELLEALEAVALQYMVHQDVLVALVTQEVIHPRKEIMAVMLVRIVQLVDYKHLLVVEVAEQEQ
jgi:hypothetical protein